MHLWIQHRSVALIGQHLSWYTILLLLLLILVPVVRGLCRVWSPDAVINWADFISVFRRSPELGEAVSGFGTCWASRGKASFIHGSKIFARYIFCYQFTQLGTFLVQHQRISNSLRKQSRKCTNMNTDKWIYTCINNLTFIHLFSHLRHWNKKNCWVE